MNSCHKYWGLSKKKARDEAELLLKSRDETGDFLTNLSDKVSERINTYTYELLDYLERLPLALLF